MKAIDGKDFNRAAIVHWNVGHLWHMQNNASG
jgi:hypothetical protein